MKKKLEDILAAWLLSVEAALDGGLSIGPNSSAHRELKEILRQSREGGSARLELFDKKDGAS